jgi:hypothetical protein
MSIWEPQKVQIGGRMVRPYTMTRGRSGVAMPLVALEALVAATPLGLRMRHRFKWESAEIIIHVYLYSVLQKSLRILTCRLNAPSAAT